MEKKCRLCEQIKLISDFYKHPAMAGGFDTKCKECTKQQVRTNREKNIEYYRAFDRDRGSLPHRVEARVHYQKTDNGRTKANAAKKAWDVRNSDRKAASTMVGNAVRDGRLKELPCLVCGETNGIHGHHAAYDMPLVVTWLCTKHHAQLHKEFREYQRMNKS